MSTRFRLIPILLAFGLCLSGCWWTEPAPDVPQGVVDIINAIDAGDHAELERLLKAGAAPTPAGSPLSPLHAATTQFSGFQMVCDSAALKLLLDHGADPNFVDDWSGFTALEDVLSFGGIECARLLKAAGADVNRHGKSGSSVLVYAVKGVVHTGDTSILELALSWGVDPNDPGDTSDGRAFTALHEASWPMPGHDVAPAVEMLLRSGADPCIADHGQTPLDRAINLEAPAAVQKLLRDAMGRCPPKQPERRRRGPER